MSEEIDILKARILKLEQEVDALRAQVDSLESYKLTQTPPSAYQESKCRCACHRGSFICSCDCLKRIAG